MQWAHHSAIPTPKTEQDAAAVPLSCWPQHGPDAPSTLPLLWQVRRLNLVSPDTPHWEQKRMRWRSHGLAHPGHENSCERKEEVEVDMVHCCAAGSEGRRWLELKWWGLCFLGQKRGGSFSQTHVVLKSHTYCARIHSAYMCIHQQIKQILVWKIFASCPCLCPASIPEEATVSLCICV